MEILDAAAIDAYHSAKRYLVSTTNHVDVEFQRTVYVDMDGVICDFNKHFEELFGIHPSTHKDSDVDFWKVFNQNPKGFFRNLKPFHGYLEFLAFVVRHAEAYGYNVKYLTALSTMNALSLEEQLTDKIEWIKKYTQDYGILIPVCYVDHSSDKKNYAEHGMILIDDLESNIRDWREHKGTAVHHKSYATSMVDLMAAFEVFHEKRMKDTD